MEQKRKKKKQTAKERFDSILSFVKKNRLNPRVLRHFDWPLFALVTGIALFGVLSIYAATASSITEPIASVRDALITQPNYYPLLQLTWFGGGIVVMSAMLFFSYEWYGKWARIIYLGNLALLVGVLFMKAGRGGMTAFFNWSSSSGQHGFQPSEFGKIAIIISLSKVLADRKQPVNTVTELIPIGVYVIIPLFLVVLQPDFGTALVYVAITAVLLFVSGTNYKIIIGAMLSFAVILIPIWYYMNASENSFRLTRILIWLDPDSYPDEARQIVNGQIALGSGGLFGKGVFSPGSFASLGYISDDHTDFCFAIVGEAFGFIGTTGLVIAFALLLARLTRLAMATEDDFGRYLIMGVMAMFLFHIAENVCMVIGLTPVTGIPLPFISYGGSNMITNMAGIGLVMNVVMRSRYGVRETPGLHTAEL